ncbi:MAG TPA: hypothetical protein VGL56_06660 [Fimbriimonadaceae bacterium]|jgi:hypothetical protein
MKLNLLPASTRGSGGGAGSKFAWVIAILIIGGSVYFTLTMNAAGKAALDAAKNDVPNNQAAFDKVVATAGNADTVIAKSAGPLLNVNLANAMEAHSSVYPDFYDEIKTYIPSYFRIISLQATPADGNTCTVTMQGAIGSFRQYADLMLAMLRIKGAQAVSRSGYQINDIFVPPLEEDDQVGRPIKAGSPRLTDDAMQRLDVKIASAGTTDYAGVGGFGTPGLPRTRGATPTESLITVAVVVTHNLTTPNPRATLQAGSAAFAAGGTGS